MSMQFECSSPKNVKKIEIDYCDQFDRKKDHFHFKYHPDKTDIAYFAGINKDEGNEITLRSEGIQQPLKKENLYTNFYNENLADTGIRSSIFDQL